MPEEFCEGEKGDTVNEISPKGVSTKGGMKRINSVDVLKNFATQQKEKKLYIVLIRHAFSYLNSENLMLSVLFLAYVCTNGIFSLHGLIRGENMELGRDSDTGGQVTFYYYQLFLERQTYNNIYPVFDHLFSRSSYVTCELSVLINGVISNDCFWDV